MAKAIKTNLDFEGVAKPINLPNPAAAQEAATKAYVDSAVEGLAWKDSARVATTGNINLASPGASVDGITMTVNDRVLVKAQTAGAENGVYIWNGAASPATRTLDASSADELEQATLTVEEGTSAGASFRQTAVNLTLGTTPIAFTAFGTVAPAATETTAGIAEIATQAETDAGTDDARFITPLKHAQYAGRKLKYTSTVGDGSATQFTLTHNLNTRDVTISVYRNATPWDDIVCDEDRPSVNSVRLTFASAPTSNQFAVLVLG